MLGNLMNCKIKIFQMMITSDDMLSSGSLDLLVEVSELIAMLGRQEQIKESLTTYL